MNLLQILPSEQRNQESLLLYNIDLLIIKIKQLLIMISMVVHNIIY